MEIITSKPTKTAIKLSKILDKPSRQIESFLDTFRAVPAARKSSNSLPSKSELFDFYKDWLPALISEIGSADDCAIIGDTFIAFENLQTSDFTSLLLTLDPKGFNRLTRAIASN